MQLSGSGSGSLGGAEEEEVTDSWYAQHKLLVCRAKLQRVNPAGILISELRENRFLQKLPKSLAGAERVAKGDEAFNARALPANNLPLAPGAGDGGGAGGGRKPSSKGGRGRGRDSMRRCPSVSAQVDCLIDLATDPDVLVRQWWGLATWV